MLRALSTSLIFLQKLTFLGLICIAQTALAQSPDSIRNHYDSLAKIKISQLDSSRNNINNKIDSAQLRINNFLNPNLNKLAPKINRRKLQPNDTILAKQELDSIKGAFSHKVDSLRSLNLSTDKYTRKLDSLNRIGPKKYIDLVNNRADKFSNDLTKSTSKIEDKINQQLSAVDRKVNLDAQVPPELQGAKLDQLSRDPLDINVPNNPVNQLNNPLNNQEPFDVKKPNLSNISQPNIESIDKLQSAKDKVGDLNQTTDKLQSYQGDIKNISNGDLKEVKELPKTIEQKAGSLNEVKELQTQTGEINKANEMLSQAKDQDALKKMAKEQMVKQSINHFKGKEQVLTQAMDKMSKLKSKYSEVSSMKDLLKDPPNPLKGKPLIERIIPGITFEVQRMNNINVDINPVVAYRFNPRINAGLGWNERLSFTKWNQLSNDGRIYGPRVFGSFELKKGFAVKADIEKMNALVPSSPFSSDGHRRWVWSAFVGLKKDYKIIRKVKGNVQVLYNLYDDHDNSPYADRFTIRTGFEFPMKKREKPPQKP